MKKLILILAVTLNLTGCVKQRIWLLESVADGLDPQPQIEQVPE